MFRHRMGLFEQEIVTIHPGEYYSTAEDTIIATILGSCVAVGLFDPRAGRGGLNHFMLPGELSEGGIVRSPSAKYGMFAMEMLINELLASGLRKGDLRAKVFGGGAVLHFRDGSVTKIPQGNVDFAFEYLEKERIPVLASDVGGREPRKIFFYARTGKVLLKRIAGTMAGLVEREEERYLESLRRRKGGEVVLFPAPEPGAGLSCPGAPSTGAN